MNQKTISQYGFGNTNTIVKYIATIVVITLVVIATGATIVASKAGDMIFERIGFAKLIFGWGNDSIAV